jgi:DNA segregation ATPase FtsK/SpoIIIE, S-DNA-T family
MATRVEKREITPKEYAGGGEIIAVVALLAASVLLFLCLVTYSPTDWSFNTSSSQKTQNWIGVFGAVVSDLLLQTIGLTAYFLPVLIALVAWRVYRTKSLRPRVSQIFAYLLFIVSASSLISLIGWRGGIAGEFFAQNLFWLLGTIGAAILLTAIFLASLLVITNLSFASLSSSFEIAKENLLIRVEEWQTKRRERKAVEKALKEEEKPAPVKKSKPLPTISPGETIQPAAQEELESGGGKLSDLFNKFRKQPVEAKQEAEAIEEIESAQPSAEEEIKPTIGAPEIANEPKIIKEEVESSPSADSVFGNEPITITPVQHTGELNGDAVEKIEAAEAEFEKQPELPAKPQNFDNYVLPSPEFLVPAQPRIEQKDEELLAIAQELTGKTKEFNVTGRVMHICQGPVVTTYEFKPDPGVKYSRVTGLADDLCLALKAESIRIERIPGKAFVGIEVPNRERETIQLREVIESKKFRDSKSLLTLALGKTIDGLNYVADLAKMPHLLIAGATGAGKSVGVNTLVVSILYKARPDEVKFIMVDPKRLELGVYEDIPHLATPIIKDPKRAAIALKWAVSEMEKRYKDLAGWGVRNIDGFNTEVEKLNANEQFDENGEPHKKLPYIVIIIDELADLMMVSGKEVEESITRLAQMARAVGIHLVLATQRPSVDVITGLIKANFPSRISFRVSSKVDSRTIIDSNGAESLLGRGDMLFLPPATSQLVRVHGAFVDEKEIHKIVEHIKAQGRPEYDTTITKTEDELDDTGELPGRKDELFWEALKTVVMAKKASTSLLQRHLRIGYGRAAAILDAMVKEGYIGDMDGSSRARPILQKAYDDLQDISEQESV